MPTRSVSTLTGVPPADAIKADEEAVSDVFDQVSQTGSLAKAAKKLQKYAQAWEDDPEEQEYLETQRNQARGTDEKLPEQVEDAGAEGAPKMSLAQQRMMQAFADEEDGGGDIEMDGGNTISVFEQEEEDEEAFEEPGVTHLQEIQEGLWIGDLVAAMDTAGLEARGIVRSCAGAAVELVLKQTDQHRLPPSTSSIVPSSIQCLRTRDRRRARYRHPYSPTRRCQVGRRSARATSSQDRRWSSCRRDQEGRSAGPLSGGGVEIFNRRCCLLDACQGS
jgi:hypothetical protein